jgi:ribosome biogenesis GTPase
MSEIVNHSLPHLTGIVLKKLKGAYTVRVDGREVVCAVSNKLRKELLYPTAAPWSLPHRVQKVREIDVVDPIAIGDQVSFVDAGDGSGLITEVLPRRSELARQAPIPGMKDHVSQVIAANVDQIVTVCPAGQPPKRRWVLDQYLAGAEYNGIPALVCLTKRDQADEDYLREELEIYAGLGYPVVVSSAVSGEGIQAVRDALSGKVSVLLGKSGVGKTSLLNAIQPGLGLRVKAVDDHTGEGRHTTTHLEMFDLDAGGWVVDTPGQREFKLYRADPAEIAYLFPENRPYLGICKFGADCAHDQEPGCAVRSAAMAGKIAPTRYKSYLRLSAD